MLKSFSRLGMGIFALFCFAAVHLNAQCLWTTSSPYYTSPLPFYTNTNPCSGNPSAAITKVQTTGGAVTNLNNSQAATTQCSGSGYQYYGGAGNTLVVNAGAQVTCSLSATGSANFFARIYVWLDKQHDGRFDLSDTLNTSASFIGTGVNNGKDQVIKFTIPVSASNGNSRIRFRIGTIGATATGPSADACQPLPSGETEDYDIRVINPCLEPSVISVSNITCNSADIAWSLRPNADYYDYWVDTTGPYGIGSYPWPSSYPPGVLAIYNPTTTNSAHVPGVATAGKDLLPHTKYYVYVRSLCDVTNKPSSQYWDTSKTWAVDSFTTLTCCVAPTVTIQDITDKTALATWNAVPTVLGYDFAWTIQPGQPSAQSYTNTSATSYLITGLQPATTYYFMLRAHCSEVPYSDWASAQFGTLNPVGIKVLNESDFNLTVLPNPVKDKLTVLINGYDVGAKKLVNITDIRGQVVEIRRVNAANTDISTGNWSPGLYFVNYTDGKLSRTVKFIKE